MDMLIKAAERNPVPAGKASPCSVEHRRCDGSDKLRDALLGGSDLVQNPDGTWGVTSRPGMLERTVGKVLENEPVKTGIILISSILGLIIFIRGLISMWAAVQRQRMNQRNMGGSAVPADENVIGHRNG